MYISHNKNIIYLMKTNILIDKTGEIGLKIGLRFLTNNETL
ncbi:hypothetical protein KL86DYS2_10446 [uncultured Dysgonomonas sp.]|uniref:Uncharacterized protein n=1 Tax=uncultured Dysgonomonas sp. TaxID=206096 RepID=A0A212J0B8_9BACT|nr:hypothetical protein KL86DYS2_10446 [uncultured Dysgonomonas sp.]